MLNKNKLCGKIAGAGYKHHEVAKMIGMNKNTFSSRINGRSSFCTDEIDAICPLLGISDPGEKAEIFLG